MGEKKTITIPEGECVPSGSIELIKDGSPGLDIALLCEGDETPFKVMEHAQAIQLRDALIELYPLTDGPPAPRFTVKERCTGPDHRFFAVYEQVAPPPPCLHKVADRIETRDMAEKIAAALNKEAV